MSSESNNNEFNQNVKSTKPVNSTKSNSKKKNNSLSNLDKKKKKDPKPPKSLLQQQLKKTAVSKKKKKTIQKPSANAEIQHTLKKNESAELSANKFPQQKYKKSYTASNSCGSGSGTKSKKKKLDPVEDEEMTLADLVQSVNPGYALTPVVEELVLDMAEDFVENVSAFASKLAKHRQSKSLEAKDVEFCLKKHYQLLPKPSGATSSSIYSGATGKVKLPKTSMHTQRLNIKKRVKKLLLKIKET